MLHFFFFLTEIGDWMMIWRTTGSFFVKFFWLFYYTCTLSHSSSYHRFFPIRTFVSFALRSSSVKIWALKTYFLSFLHRGSFFLSFFCGGLGLRFKVHKGVIIVCMVWISKEKKDLIVGIIQTCLNHLRNPFILNQTQHGLAWQW